MLLLLFATAFAEFRSGECWTHPPLHGPSRHAEMIRIVRVGESKLVVEPWSNRPKRWDRSVTVGRQQVSDNYEPAKCPK